MRRLWPLVLLVLLVLPGLPPVLRLGVERVLPGLGFSGRIGRISGYALFGVTLEDVDLKGPGVRLVARRLRLDYQLLGLLAGKLPVAVDLSDARVGLDWARVLAGGGGAGGGPTPVLTGLRLRRVRLAFGEDRALALPPLEVRLEGRGPYRVAARLAGVEASGELALRPRPSLAFRVPATALRYWYPEVRGGTIEGRVVLGKDGLAGTARVAGGEVRVVGFSLGGVAGTLRLAGDRLTAELAGRGLGGPVRGTLDLDLARPGYRFRVEGRPLFRELARHFGVALPLAGAGRLVLEGAGWENLRLTGHFSGPAELLGYPLRTAGTLAYDGVFRLTARSEGRFYDRAVRLDLDLAGERWRLAYEDDRGGAFALRGRGGRAEGTGRLAWPSPLSGVAELRAALAEGRWRVEVRSEGVRLPLSRPFSLSGTLSGRGPEVAGRLGPLGLSGRWSDLALTLDPLPMQVGTVTGQGRWDGTLRAHLDYRSAYARLPVEVDGGPGGFRFRTPYGEARYRAGRFALDLEGVPVRVGEPLWLSARAAWQAGAWSGDWRLSGRHLAVGGVLDGRATRFAGALYGPYGPLALIGEADGGGLRLKAGGLRLVAGGGRLALKGALRYGPLALSGNLAGGPGGYRGALSLASPWLGGRLYGRGPAVWAELDGYARLSGEVWPRPDLAGQTRPLRFGPVEVPALPLRVTRERVALGEGGFDLAGGRGRAVLPLRYAGRPARLGLAGDLRSGRLWLESRDLRLAGEGPWADLPVAGESPTLGLRVRGRLDLPGLGYRFTLTHPGFEGALSVRGRGARAVYAGALRSGGGLRLRGAGREAELVAEGFSLAPLGLPVTLRGRLVYRGGLAGRLVAESPYGRLVAEGSGTLALRYAGPGLAGTGRLSTRGLVLDLRSRHPWITGRVRLGLDAKGLWAGGEGRYRVPFLAERRWWLSLSGANWRLTGPLTVSGRGLRYRGRVEWASRLGPVRGTLEGTGADLTARLTAGLPRGEARLTLATRPLAVTARLPGGTLVYRAGGLEAGAFDLGALGRALGLPVAGRLRGRLGGGGLLSGEVAAYGWGARFALREGGGLVWLPGLGGGLRLRFGGGVELEGLGRLAGRARLDREGLSGNLLYRGGVGARLALAGTLGRPELRLTARGAGLSVEGRLSGRRYRVEARYRGPLAEGALVLRGEGLRYRGEGRLRTRRGLLQGGPLRVEGEGLQWRLSWDAPMAVGYRDGVWTLAGVAPLEAGHQLAGELRYGPGGFSGRLALTGPWIRGRAVGTGPLVLDLEAPWGGARLRVGPGGGLGGRLALALGPLKAEAHLGGRLPDPTLEGSGVVAGRGARLPFRFGYRHGPWLVARGGGLGVRLSGRFLEAHLRGFDLAPYLGLPLVLDLEGADALARFRAPLALRGPGVALLGTLDLAKPGLRLAGPVPGGRLDLSAGPRGARLALDHRNLKGALAWRPGEGLSGALDLDLPLPGGALTGRFRAGEGRLSLAGRGRLSGRLDYWPLKAAASGALRYRVPGLGAVALEGRGPRLVLAGEGGLGPLSGSVDLVRGRLVWGWRGPLPRGLGRLEAGGRFPGRWLEGKARVLGQRLRLTGEGTVLTLATAGLFAHLTPAGARVLLAGYALGPLRLEGRLEGPWRGLRGALAWRAGGASGRLRLTWDGALRLAAEGDLAGRLAVGRGGWRGRLAFPGGELGLGPGFAARGRLFGKALAFDPAAGRLTLGGLSVRYPWAFEGREAFGPLEAVGDGGRLRLAAGGFVVRLDPEPLTLELGYRGGRGAVVYRAGRLTGRLEGRTGPLDWTLAGRGATLALTARHPELAALPYPAGRLEAALGLSGAWRLTYAAGPFRAEGEGTGLAGGVRLRSPYGGGRLELAAGGPGGRLRLRDLPFFGWGLDLDLEGRGFAFALKSPAGEVRGRGRLRGWALPDAEASALGLDLARLPGLSERLPYLRGRLALAARYRDGEAYLQAGSADLGVGDRRHPLALSLRYREGLSGELRYAGLDLRFARGRGWRAEGTMAAFPLDLPVAMVAGPLPGRVRLTGRFAGRWDPARPLDAWFELSGERLEATSGDERLLGRVALAFKDRTLELRALDLAGTGRWRGGGRWRLGAGGDLWLRAERTDFTPLLRLWPPLARWRPEARGSLFLEARGRTLTAQGSAAFAVAGVQGRFWGLGLAYRADGTLDLHLDGQVERPVQSRFRLTGRGRLDDLVLAARGDLEAPLIGRLEGLKVALRYPDLTVAGRGPGLALTGRLRPLDLRLEGRLPLRYRRYYLEGGEARVDLRLAERAGVYRLAGDVAVLRALLAVPKKRPVVETRRGRALPLAFDRVRIHAEGGVVVNEPLAQGELAGEVFLAGTAADPYLAGEVRALRGNFLLLNHRFRVLLGRARFLPAAGVYPELFLKARTEAGGAPVYLLAEGRFARRGERAELVLDTCLSTVDVAGLEACKLAPQEPAAAALLGLGEGDLAEQAVGVAVKNLLIGRIESELARSLGLDLFQIETRAFEGGGLASTQFTLGKYLSPEFFVAYRLDFDRGSRVYASYQHDGLKLTFATDLSAEPSPEFSVRYAVTDDLAVLGRVARDAFSMGLEWRP